MTYNVNYGLAGDRATLDAIRSRDVDLVLLQETNEGWERSLRKEFAERYPHQKFFHCCGAGGLAVLSKHELRAIEYLDAKDWFPAVRVVADSPLGDVQILSVHLRPQISDSGSVVSGYFTTGGIREMEINAFTAKLDDTLPTIVVGDFNESPGGGAIEILETRGFVNVLPEFQPSATTWRWPTSLGEVTSTLDHIVYDGAHFEPLDAHVLPAGRSDHLPVVATFIKAKPRARE